MFALLLGFWGLAFLHFGFLLQLIWGVSLCLFNGSSYCFFKFSLFSGVVTLKTPSLFLVTHANHNR
ncbi:hypothetical protein C7N43_23405 [Sphingobacteriales bacterium UPWRP_1]|nr:hypothetical protein B6N25_15535 [Sphingobacteriales bacterium TSM_CSS]PSJ74529.1 hypothetical protein C7N43_23405 [Sphingobacteriales bacterium UPWRP_1]